MTQQPKLIECETCKKSGVIKQYIDFEMVGHNNNTGKNIYLKYDHGTKDIHANKKACIYGCNTVIVWDTSGNRYRDLEGGLFHDNPCEGVERYKIMAEKQKDIIDPVRRTQMIIEKEQQQQQQQAQTTAATATTTEAQAKAIDPVITHSEGKLGHEFVNLNIPAETSPNPIAAELDKAKSTTTSELQKTISFMWTMVKEIDRKVSAFEQLKHDREVMLDAIDKRFDSIDNILADMLTKIEPVKKQFKPSSDLLKQQSESNSQPSAEEIEAMFDEEDDSH